MCLANCGRIHLADTDQKKAQESGVDDGVSEVVNPKDAVEEEQVLIMESKPLDWVHGKLLDEMYKGG
jgi:hypothetical protein